MTNEISEVSKTPGMVIFVAVLNFISTAFFLFLSTLCLLVLIFGNVGGVTDFVTRRMEQLSQTPNFSYGLTLIFSLSLVVALFLAIFFLFIGIGLLKGRKLAWYFQIAMSVLGLIGFPIGTAINVTILIFFFQPPIRNFFKV